jgi:hypothetical protein
MVLLTPTIGQWYLNKSGTAFEVVAIDEASDAIDIQFVDGTVDELDFERWARSTTEEIGTPDDCISSLDIPGDADIIQNEFVPRSDWLDTLDFMDIEYVDLDDSSEFL